MKKNERICYGCMAIIPKEVKSCPYCSFQDASYKLNPRSLPLGTLLHERYTIGKVIGEGGFGITYIGWDTIEEIPVAIKEYFPSNIASRDCSQGGSTFIYFFNNKDENVYQTGFDKYTHEAETLKQFGDLEGIVSIRDFFHENNTAYIVMEYVEGITLKEYLATNGTLTPKETFELMMPVMLALEKIHEKGIIHRDISPDNIMIRIDGAFKLIDFGAARLMNDESGKSLTIILKRGFAPEEQYRTKGQQGPWTDVYALCATMYKMITNTIPPEAMDRLIEDDLKPLNEYNLDIPKVQSDAIAKGLSVKAKDRFQSVYDLRLALTNEAEQPKDLHMIATFQEKDGTIMGYRLFDMNDNRIIDMPTEELIQKMQTGSLSINNVIVYQRYVQTIGGSVKHYPVMNLMEHLQQNDTYYYVEHSLARGYLCLNYKGVRSYFNEVEMQELLEEHRIANEDKLHLFTSLRDKKAQEFIPSRQPESSILDFPDPISLTEELKENSTIKEEPKHVKLSLKTSYSNSVVSSKDTKITKSAGTQLRLKMLNETQLSSKFKDKKSKKRH